MRQQLDEEKSIYEQQLLMLQQECQSLLQQPQSKLPFEYSGESFQPAQAFSFPDLHHFHGEVLTRLYVQASSAASALSGQINQNPNRPYVSDEVVQLFP